MQTSLGSEGRTRPAFPASVPRDGEDRNGPQGAGNEASSVTLPKDGNAFRGRGERFRVSPVTEVRCRVVPVACSAGQSDLAPRLGCALQLAEQRGLNTSAEEQP